MSETTIIWIGIMSLWTFGIMGLDKNRAKKKERRIPEKNLWILAIFGGGIGAYLGMILFRHKTRRTSFRIDFLMLAIVHILFVVYLLDIPLPTMNSFT